MITPCRKLNDLTYQAAQARQGVLSVYCKDPQPSKDVSTVVQVSGRIYDMDCLLLDLQHIPTASSVTPQFYTIADMAVKHGKTHSQKMLIKEACAYLPVVK